MVVKAAVERGRRTEKDGEGRRRTEKDGEEAGKHTLLIKAKA
jgi:hypothetical protein